MSDRKASILAEAAEIAMDGWHSVEKAKAFACSVSDYLLALTSAPAERPDAFNRRLRAQLEQEWAEVQALMRAYAPAETPPAAGAIDARGQEPVALTDVQIADISAGFVSTYKQNGQTHHSFNVLPFARAVIQADRASRDEPPAAAGDALAVELAKLVLEGTRWPGSWANGHVSECCDCGVNCEDEHKPECSWYADRARSLRMKALASALAATPAPEPLEVVREAGRKWAYDEGHEHPGESADAYLEGYQIALASRAAPQASGDDETKGGV